MVAIANPLDSFVWGQNGSMKTPEQIERERAIADALLKQGMDFSPITSPLQGLARVANAAAGAYRERGSSKADAANAQANQSMIANLLSGMGGQQFPAAPTAQGQTASITPDAAGAVALGAVAPSFTPLADGADWLSYANQGATRNQPLSDKLTSSLGSFLPEMGVTMKVFSGGQDATGLRRTGSHRHDHGNAADVFFYKDGRQLDWNNPQDLPIFEEIVRRGHAAGITGFGAGEGYMRPGSMHIGFGSPAVWGAGGRGSNAPDWLRQAFNSPAGPAPAVAAVNALAESQPAQVASLDPSVGMAQTRQVPLSPGQPVSSSPEAQRVIETLTSPQSMTGGEPMGMQPQQVAQDQPENLDLSQIPVTAGGNAGVYQPRQSTGINPAIIQALASPYASPQVQKIASILLQQQMQQSDPLRKLEMDYKRAQIAKLNDPNARDKFGNSVIWGQDANGNWVAMQPSSGGGLVAAKTPDGIKLSPPGMSNLNLGTEYGMRDRNGQVINTVPIDNFGKAAAAAGGKAQGEASFDLPRVEQNAQQTIDVLERMKNHPGRAGSTGFIEGMLPSRTADQVDFQSLVDQTQGQTFLQAFQMLKGGGQITDIEGKKATDAISRLRNQRLSDEDYLRAINDLEDVVRTGLDRARKQAGQGTPAPASNGGVVDYRDYFGGQ